MLRSLIGNIFLLNIFSLSVGSPKFLKTLNGLQTQLLDSFKPCTIRMVFLENKISASEDVLSFLHYYQNHSTFILESIPFDSRKFVINGSAASRMQDMRFNTCYTIFYFQDQFFDTLSIPDRKKHIYSYFVSFSVYLRNEDPTSIIFMSIKDSIVGDEYTYVKYIDTTSSFYILAFPYHSILMICVTCNTLVPVKSFSESSWRQIHIQTKIPVSALYPLIWDTEPANSFDTCGIFPNERFTLRNQPLSSICFFREMKQRLNTTDSRKLGIRAIGETTFLILLSGDNNSYFKKHSTKRSVFLSYGTENSYYQFGALTYPYRYDINSLVKPFDCWTWAYIIVSVLSLCLYFRTLRRITNKRTLSETHVISILMEQSQEIVTRCGGLRKGTCGLLVCWIFLVFFIGNAYKGVLFTLLTTLSFPAVPKTLQEVVRSDFFVMSTQILKSKDGDIVSMAKNEIGNILKEVDQNRLNISDVDLYKKVYESIVFLGQSGHPSKLFVAMKKGDKLRRQDGKYTAIPEKLIMFDPENVVEYFKELNLIFTTNTMLISGQKINLVWLRKLWMFRRNVISKLALPILMTLVESGIHKRWGHYARLQATFLQLNYVKQQILDFLNASNSRVSPNDNIIAYLLFKPYTAQPSPETEKPITMEFFIVFLKMLCYFLFVCGVSFFIERIRKIKFVLFRNTIKEKMSKLFHVCRNGIIKVSGLIVRLYTSYCKYLTVGLFWISAGFSKYKSDNIQKIKRRILTHRKS